MFFKKNINKKNKKGFTLIELLVSLSIFTFVLTASVSALLAMVTANKQTQVTKTVMDSLDFVLEEISRDMRVGTNYHCGGITHGGAHGSDCSGGNLISYMPEDALGSTPERRRVAYRITAGGVIQKKPTNGLGWIALTDPSIVQITRLRFFTQGIASASDELQPRVTVVLSGYVVVSGSDDRDIRRDFNLQTTISQRLLDRR